VDIVEEVGTWEELFGIVKLIHDSLIIRVGYIIILFSLGRMYNLLFLLGEEGDPC
jgi:hypothetical protein